LPFSGLLSGAKNRCRLPLEERIRIPMYQERQFSSMKPIGLLVCLCLLVLAVSANPPGTGMTGTISKAMPLAQVSGNSTPPNGPSDPVEVEAFFDQVMPA